ncbi:ABC transporter ATP-binding protein [Candidatus Aminicenantes bacterium AC-335-A11]|jgi:ABC-2 type transport system ATP-binding protein|nr:ABC transporter ATP-binding protein [SCandidatus Aminicenantes bacterium Aminicenantia_JdfR_composite]MCP2597324.1 ABC transporter ATP-binding protein [Candidatus Aminicenantes bacterium AC-335-G13]MCP2606397.1 ABC transporter ATP-binding protein [Candidatus Aminicenantes bacterium AC-708-I09]MCP2619028.1 ABC transporter ATP-binding protein [Candidatus Aminicenantes bacterium AC-335-A11]
MIEVENLTKKYGELIAVKNLNFKVEEGKIWGFLGPNGAGKTTTMRILTGYLPATEGKAFVGGFDVFEKPMEVKKITGYLPENLPLYPEMTVYSYLNFVAQIKGVPSKKRKERIEMAIEKSRLEEVRNRLIRNLSRGYKQRVGIAQALIHDPKVLILDEPTMGLDPAQIVEIRQLIKSLKGEHTIILSTHILAEVTQVCDGVVIINEGKLMASGSLEELASSFADKEGVSIKLKKTGEEVINGIREINGVENVVQKNGDIEIEWKKGIDLRDEIVKKILEKNWGLLEMKPLTLSLEELYLKVISGR